jgi:large conductance mechanosensitive channel
MVVFIIIKGLNAMKKKQAEEQAPAGPSSTDALLMEIRDSLKSKELKTTAAGLTATVVFI